MDTFLVTPENVVLGCRSGELMEPVRAVGELLRARGLEAWPEMEAELYHGRGETLLIARPAPPVCARSLAAPVRRRRKRRGR